MPMQTNLATRNSIRMTGARSQSGARDLKKLIPLIRDELKQCSLSRDEHYHRVGELLIEAKKKVAHGGWSKWLRRNFELSHCSARLYMRWARTQNGNGVTKMNSLHELKNGVAIRKRRRRHTKKQQPLDNTYYLHGVVDGTADADADLTLTVRWETSLGNLAGIAASLEAYWAKQFGKWEKFKAPSHLVVLARQAADAWQKIAVKLEEKCDEAAK